MIITSSGNEKIILLKKLQEKKFREKSGLCFLEGEKLIKDAVDSGAEAEEFFVAESKIDKFRFAKEPIIVSDAVFNKLSDTVSSQGVAATVRLKKQKLSVPSGNCLILDAVRDPGNLGTLLRTAVACGFCDVYACNCADAYSPKVLRAAMSAHFRLNLYTEFALEEVLRTVKSSCTVASADMHGENVFAYRPRGKIALLLGNEANGISEFALKNSDCTLRLPMENGLESLNVAVAGSVIMYLLYGRKD